MSYEVVMLIGETAHSTPERMKPPFFCINASVELGRALNQIGEHRKESAICPVRIPNVLPFADNVDEDIEYADAYGNELLMYSTDDAKSIIDEIAYNNAYYEVALGILNLMEERYEWYGKRGVVFYCK